MAEISSLKIKLASADKDRRDLDDRLRLSQVTACILQGGNLTGRSDYIELYLCRLICNLVIYIYVSLSVNTQWIDRNFKVLLYICGYVMYQQAQTNSQEHNQENGMK